MTAYGFRIFVVKVHKGRSRESWDFSQVGAGANKQLRSEIAAIRDRLLFGAPKYHSDPEDVGAGTDDKIAKKHPYLRVYDISQINKLLNVNAEYGREGDYEILMQRATGGSTELKGQAPGRRFRLWFALPEKGDCGLVIAETRGQTQPGDTLIHWLRVLNQHAAVSFPDGERKEDAWYRWDARPAVDLDRLSGIWSDTSDYKITLKRHTVNADGSRGSGPLRLTAEAVPVTRMTEMKTIVGDWWQDRANGRKTEKKHDAAVKLGALVLPRRVVDDLSFDDGEVTFSENGKVQTISPSKIDRLWVYPVGETYPNDAELLKVAAPVVNRIAKALKIEISI